VPIELIALASFRVVLSVQVATLDAIHLVTKTIAVVQEAWVGVELKPLKPLNPIADCVYAPACAGNDACGCLEGCLGDAWVHERNHPCEILKGGKAIDRTSLIFNINIE
jgi:hypothetical protein